MPIARIELLRPHSAQQDIINNAARFNVISCGRRFGKTTLGIDRLSAPNVLGAPNAWFSPTYKMLAEVWREAVRIFEPITVDKSVQEKRLGFITGGSLEFWSLDNPDVARGRKYKRIIVDEAAMIRDLADAWQMVIRPTLADYQGDGYFLSTPKGRNYYWRMYQSGIDPNDSEWRSWQMPTDKNPHIPPSEVEAMKNSLPERIYRQEILAEFIDDSGGVFRNVAQCATAEEEPPRGADGQYVMGVDWGKHNDFTVLTIIDVARTVPKMVYMDRFNQIDYTLQIGRLAAAYEKYNPYNIIAENNSMGDPLIEQLQRQGMPVIPFQTTNASKTAIIEGLALAFEKQEIEILNDPVLISELQAYEMDRLPSGTFRYNAPSGMHDDTVMSTALCYSRAKTPVLLFGA